MSAEQLIWVVYQGAAPDGDGGQPVAVSSFPPQPAFIDEIKRRFEQKHGYEPDLFFSAVPFYDAPPVPAGET
jgi:hypothetical protein